MNDIEQSLNHMQRGLDEIQRCIDNTQQSEYELQIYQNNMQRNLNNMQRSLNDRQRKQYLESHPINESQRLNHEKNRKEESQTEVITNHEKFQEYKKGDITHIEIDNKEIDLNNIKYNKQKFIKIINSLPPLLTVAFLQKTEKRFFLSLTEERDGVKFKYEKDLGLFSRGSSIKAMVEFLDLFFDATKIPFKMEFTRDDKKILYFYKNCNEY